MTQPNPVPLTREEQIAQARRQIKMFNVLQILMPLLMLGMAAALPYTMPSVSVENKNIMVAILCVFAAADFGLIRFMILPMAQKRLNDLESGS